jgi:hypothetical protein
MGGRRRKRAERDHRVDDLSHTFSLLLIRWAPGSIQWAPGARTSGRCRGAVAMLRQTGAGCGKYGTKCAGAGPHPSADTAAISALM